MGILLESTSSSWQDKLACKFVQMRMITNTSIVRIDVYATMETKIKKKPTSGWSKEVHLLTLLVLETACRAQARMEGLPSHPFQPEHREYNQFPFCQNHRKPPNSFSTVGQYQEKVLQTLLTPSWCSLKNMAHRQLALQIGFTNWNEQLTSALISKVICTWTIGAGEEFTALPTVKGNEGYHPRTPITRFNITSKHKCIKGIGEICLHCTRI